MNVCLCGFKRRRLRPNRHSLWRITSTEASGQGLTTYAGYQVCHSYLNFQDLQTLYFCPADCFLVIPKQVGRCWCWYRYSAVRVSRLLIDAAILCANLRVNIWTFPQYSICMLKCHTITNSLRHRKLLNLKESNAVFQPSNYISRSFWWFISSQ